MYLHGIVCHVVLQAAPTVPSDCGSLVNQTRDLLFHGGWNSPYPEKTALTCPMLACWPERAWLQPASSSTSTYPWTAHPQLSHFNGSQPA